MTWDQNSDRVMSFWVSFFLHIRKPGAEGGGDLEIQQTQTKKREQKTIPSGQIPVNG